MKPSFPRIDENAFYTAAQQHHSAGNLKDARELYRAILTQNRKHAGAIFGMGTMAMQVEQPEKAVDYIKKAIKIGPATAPMHINLGAALRHLERYDEAVTTYNRAIRLDKNNAAAFYNKGRALQELEDFKEARTCYERAIELSDSDADAWVNLGTVQMEIGDFNPALYSFEQAARLAPELSAPYGNAAGVLFELDLHEIGMILINKALAVEPENIKFRFQLSNFFLMSENFERGWADFDLRFVEVKSAKKYYRPEPPPYWNEEDIKGKKILVWTEQGFGEEIIAASIVQDLIKSGAQCTLECSPRLVPAFQDAFPEIEVLSWSRHNLTVTEADPPFDFQYPALSFLKVFRPTIDSILSTRPVIRPETKQLKSFRSKYEKMANGKPIIGLTWRSKNEKIGPRKSIPLSDLKPILQTENVFFVNLQYGDCKEEIEDVKEKLGVDVYIDEEVEPYGELAPVFAQIAAMDLVISVSNSNAHFAGAMNIPTWMMIPKGRGRLWFWFMERLNSPWYPSVRLFRQASVTRDDISSWPEVISEVASALPGWLADR